MDKRLVNSAGGCRKDRASEPKLAGAGVEDSLGEGRRRFLGQVVSDASRYNTMLVAA